MNCRHCQRTLEHLVLDLGAAPPSNAYLTAAQLRRVERYFPLRIFVCAHCWLVQTDDYADVGELFTAEYAYFSSTSETWLSHAARFFEQIREMLQLDCRSHVIEVASNDGYLLKNFVAAGIPCLGIEPTASTAAAAEALGIPVERSFFGMLLASRLAAEGRLADLIVGNNVFAHVPDVNDFAAGLKTALKPGGTIALEFPHLMRLLEHTQFDTVYHEHFSYLCLHSAASILGRAGLRVWDVEELPTHGGSLRLYGCHDDDRRTNRASVPALLQEERRRGLTGLGIYRSFQSSADRVKTDLTAFLIEKKRAGETIAGYGAAAKGNTLLNYAGIKPDLLPFVCDAAPSKQGKYLPGSRIPILPPETLRAYRPQYLLILPWNIADEIIGLHSYIREWGGKFVVAVPTLRIIE